YSWLPHSDVYGEQTEVRASKYARRPPPVPPPIFERKGVRFSISSAARWQRSNRGAAQNQVWPSCGSGVGQAGTSSMTTTSGGQFSRTGSQWPRPLETNSCDDRWGEVGALGGDVGAAAGGSAR